MATPIEPISTMRRTGPVQQQHRRRAALSRAGVDERGGNAGDVEVTGDGGRGHENEPAIPAGSPDRTCGWVMGRVVGPSHMSIEPGSAGSNVRGTQLASSSIRRTPKEYS